MPLLFPYRKRGLRRERSVERKWVCNSVIDTPPTPLHRGEYLEFQRFYLYFLQYFLQKTKPLGKF